MKRRVAALVTAAGLGFGGTLLGWTWTSGPAHLSALQTAERFAWFTEHEDYWHGILLTNTKQPYRGAQGLAYWVSVAANYYGLRDLSPVPGSLKQWRQGYRGRMVERAVVLTRQGWIVHLSKTRRGWRVASVHPPAL